MPYFSVQVTIQCDKSRHISNDDRVAAEEKLRRDAMWMTLKLGGDNFKLELTDKYEIFDPVRLYVEMQWRFFLTPLAPRTRLTIV